jgi:hypothetical protein
MTPYESGAVFSPCRTWRYTLWRRWGVGGDALVCIGLNPSTADEREDDPTIRRVIGFAQRWHFSALVMLNVFAYRATLPADMRTAPDPIGPENDKAIAMTCAGALMVLCAWGAHGSYRGRDTAVMRLIPQKAFCLGLTQQGAPRHPLYIKGDTNPRPYVHVY